MRNYGYYSYPRGLPSLFPFLFSCTDSQVISLTSELWHGQGQTSAKSAGHTATTRSNRHSQTIDLEHLNPQRYKASRRRRLRWLGALTNVV